MAPLFGFDGLPLADQIVLQQFCRGPRANRPFALIHKAFEYFADTNPNAVAAIHDSESVTYDELEASANVLAHKLLASGLKPRERICLVVSRSIQMLVAIIAILKCGCQYIPLDGKVVTDKTLRHIVHDTAARFILCLEEFGTKSRQCSDPVTQLQFIDHCVGDRTFPWKRVVCSVKPTDGAYIIYTSGSELCVPLATKVFINSVTGTTGKPKGVDVSHSNVTNLLTAAPGNLGIKLGAHVAQLLSVSFDMAAWEILGTLMNGGTLNIRTSDWASTLAHVDTVIATPSILGTLKPDLYPNIKVVALAGEPCPKALADCWSRRVELYNCCGPTEVTIVNTIHKQQFDEDISIGKPVPNTNVYILDESERPVPIGESGIMWAGGSCVSRGYLHRPEETRKRYKLDKFAADGSVMFNTGDRARWRADGTLVHLGRIDDQVKVRGFRVDLDGVSAVVESYAGVRAACTIRHGDSLITFYEMQEGTQDTMLAAHVKERLPYYAVPLTYCCQLLPRTSNGKIDKKELALWAGNLRGNTLAEQSAARPVISYLPLWKQHDSEIQSNYDSVSSEEEKPKSMTYDLPEKPELSTCELPEKKGTHGLRAVRHSFFSLYRRFFCLAFISNLTVLVILSVRAHNTQKIRLTDLATASSVNITVAILMRQDYVINAIWTTFCSMPRSAPLFIRKQCAKVGIHLGGVHSGCALAGSMWFTALTVVATNDVVELGVRSAFDPVVLIFSYLSVTLLIVIIAVAHPKFRSRYHNRFEMSHRLLGWTALVLLWVQALSFIASSLSKAHPSFGYAVARSLDVWFLFVATVSVLLPWLRLRLVKVRSEVLSSHAIRLHFDYCTPTPGTAVRISERPLLEWHAFATVAIPGEKGFSLVVSNAGDWTSRQIERAPTSLYVRGIPACGVLRIVPLFRRVVLVATGSGIGPCLPIILAKKVPMRVFWSTPNPEDTFGQDIINNVLAADRDAIIHNTRISGKPDMVAISWRLLQESGAEAVCIISNQKLTRKVVYAMEARGVPAYGAIWDS